MSSFFKKIISLFFLNKNEKYFINKIKTINTRKNKILLFNATEDYRALCFGYTLANEEKYRDYKFVFYLPLISFYNYNQKRNLIFFFFKFYYKNFLTFFRNYKWKKLYYKFGNSFLEFNNWNFFKEIYFLEKSKNFLNKNISSVEDLKKLRYRNILFGDLIYDTYLRFGNKFYFDLKNDFIIEIFAKLLFRFEEIQKYILKSKTEFFFTNQLGYLHHGIIIRILKKNKKKIYNFFWNTGPYYSKLAKHHYPYDFKKYPQIFNKIKDKKNAIKLAKNLLKKQFSGKIIQQQNFMPFSVYGKSNNDNLDQHSIKVVIFLHCFVDVPLSSKGRTIFQDYYYWTEETLLYFQKLKIEKHVAIKPHPDSKPISLECVDFFKNKYPKFIWLEKNISNTEIFRKRPLLGISAAGTVLHELAYHAIIAISAGEHPSIAYNFVFTPKNKSDYFELINKALNKKLFYKKNYKNKILEFVYCNFIYDDSEKDFIAKKIKLKTWNFNHSSVLIKFVSNVKKYIY